MAECFQIIFLLNLSDNLVGVQSQEEQFLQPATNIDQQ